MFFNKNSKEPVKSAIRFLKREKDLNELENKAEIQNEENEDCYSQIDFYKIYQIAKFIILNKHDHDEPLILNIDDNIKIKVFDCTISALGDHLLIEILINQIKLSYHDFTTVCGEWRIYSQEFYHKMPKEVVESINNWLTKTVNECKEKEKQKQLEREQRQLERKKKEREKHDQEEIVLEQIYQQYRKDN